MADIKIARSACEILIEGIEQARSRKGGGQLSIGLLLNAIAELAGRVQILEENEKLRTHFSGEPP